MTTFGSMFEPLLNLNWTLPNLNWWSGSMFGKISWTECKVWFCIQRNSGRTELNRTSASLLCQISFLRNPPESAGMTRFQKESVRQGKDLQLWNSCLDPPCYDFCYFVFFTYVFSLFLEVSHGAAALTHFSLTHSTTIVLIHSIAILIALPHWCSIYSGQFCRLFSS